MVWIKRILLLVLSIATLHQIAAQSSKYEAAKGYDLFQDSLYEESIDQYEKSLEIEADPRYQYNLGNAYLKNGDVEKAQQQFNEVLKSNAAPSWLKSKSAYNLGNLSFEREEYEEAIKNYKEALTNNPEDVRASENLQIARSRMMQQQQQQQQQQQNQEPQDGNEEQQSNQQQQQPQDEQNENENPNQQEENAEQESQPQPEEQDPNSEKEKPESKSNRVTMERAEELMDYLDKLESETKERLNGDVLEDKKKGGSKKIVKDW